MQKIWDADFLVQRLEGRQEVQQQQLTSISKLKKATSETGVKFTSVTLTEETANFTRAFPRKYLRLRPDGFDKTSGQADDS